MLALNLTLKILNLCLCFLQKVSSTLKFDLNEFVIENMAEFNAFGLWPKSIQTAGNKLTSQIDISQYVIKIIT